MGQQNATGMPSAFASQMGAGEGFQGLPGMGGMGGMGMPGLPGMGGMPGMPGMGGMGGMGGLPGMAGMGGLGGMGGVGGRGARGEMGQLPPGTSAEAPASVPVSSPSSAALVPRSGGREPPAPPPAKKEGVYSLLLSTNTCIPLSFHSRSFKLQSLFSGLHLNLCLYLLRLLLFITINTQSYRLSNTI